MKTVEKSVLIWFTAQEMFDLVVDVASYPQFLPWCDQTHILNTEEDGMTARIGMAFGALVGPVFDRIAATLVDAFVKRAEVVYPR